MNDNAIRILLIDDDEDAYILTSDQIADLPHSRIQMDWVATYEEGLNAILTDRYDLYLVDYRLDKEDGLTLLKKAMESGCRKPLILITGMGLEDIDTQALQAGAADYLVKGQFTAEMLDRAIRYALERARTRQELIESNEQLRQSQKMDAIGRLAGGVAHDFNNLLTAIIAYNDIAREDLGEDHPVTDSLIEVKKAAMHASELTNQLLTFSRKKMIEPLVLNINDVIEQVGGMFSRMIGKNIRISTRLDPRLDNVKADPGQLEQVLLNLVVNARDAMPDGGVIHVTTSNRTVGRNEFPDLPEGRYVCLAVADTGTGIDKNALPHIFEPFFTTKEKNKGTGIGLSTVYAIAQQSNGTILVESEPGHGTTFKVMFPRIGDATTAYTEESQVNIQHPSACVMLVEDDRAVREPLAANLSKAGYQVIEAVNGVDALELNRTFRGSIDVLVTDLLMPEMGGAELAICLKGLRPNLQVVYISGNSESIETLTGASGQVPSYLTKPFSPAALIKKIESSLTSSL